MEPHRFAIRVYYEDTDAGGVVYYANYLKFCERARTEWLRDFGFDHSRLLAEAGLVFVVARFEARYRRPAILDDLLVVETRVEGLSRARATLAQTVLRGEETLVAAVCELALVDRATLRPARWPDALRARIGV